MHSVGPSGTLSDEQHWSPGPLKASSTPDMCRSPTPTPGRVVLSRLRATGLGHEHEVEKKTFVSEKLKELSGQIGTFSVDVFTRNDGREVRGTTECAGGETFSKYPAVGSRRV